MTGTSPPGRIPRASITSDGTSPGSAMPVSSASHTPSGNRSSRSAASSRASRVLPGATGAGQREQARPAEQPAEVGQLPLPAQEARQLGRQVVLVPRAADTAGISWRSTACSSWRSSSPGSSPSSSASIVRARR